MKFSENYEFNMPMRNDGDIVDVDVISQNFEKIDKLIKNNENATLLNERAIENQGKQITKANETIGENEENIQKIVSYNSINLLDNFTNFSKMENNVKYSWDRNNRTFTMTAQNSDATSFEFGTIELNSVVLAGRSLKLSTSNIIPAIRLKYETLDLAGNTTSAYVENEAVIYNNSLESVTLYVEKLQDFTGTFSFRLGFGYGKSHSELLAEAKSYTDEKVSVCVAKNQGTENVGKILVVGTDGNLTLADMPEGGASGDVIGVLDEANNILLSGNLADGTYTLKYENTDGTYTEIGTLEVGKIKTNFVDTTSSDWIPNGRINDSGDIRTDMYDTDFVTNFIPCQKGDVIFVENANIIDIGFSKIVMYDDGKTLLSCRKYSEHIAESTIINGTATETEAEFEVNVENTAYMRMVVRNVANPSNLIINIKRNGEWL